MLERVERKRNTLTLLVGMQTSTATMENSVNIQKTGNRTAIRPRNPTAGHTHWGNQNWERHPMFITTLFIIARTCRQPKCPSADKWIRKLWYIYTMEDYGSSVPGIFQARILEWVAISFSNACMLSCFSRVRLCAIPWTAAHQTPLSTGFSRRSPHNEKPEHCN